MIARLFFFLAVVAVFPKGVIMTNLMTSRAQNYYDGHILEITNIGGFIHVSYFLMAAKSEELIDINFCPNVSENLSSKYFDMNFARQAEKILRVK